MAAVVDYASLAGRRFATNMSNSFSALTAQQYIRLVAIVGAYLLLRPYLMKLGARSQMRALEAEEKESEAAADKAQISPNELRGQSGVAIPEDSDSEEEEQGAGKTTGAADWGKAARRRQRKMVRRILEEHEKKLADEQADEEDKDIEEFLVD